MRSWIHLASAAMISVALFLAVQYVYAEGAATSFRQGGIARLSSHAIRFCGELGANTDEFFAGPAVAYLNGTFTADHALGVAACNTLGVTTVGDADAPLDVYRGYIVNGFMCQLSASPTSAVTVLTFVDDTANTTVTCSVATGETSCFTDPSLSAVVAANSAVAISSLNGTDDENAEDIACWAYITWTL